MDGKLSILVCQSYFPEVKLILERGEYPDIRVKGYPVSCLGHSADPSLMESICGNWLDKGNDAVAIGSSCIPDPSKTINKSKNLTYIQLQYCAEMIFSRELIEYYIQKRYYLVSSGWLLNYKSHIAAWGFDPELAGKFFAESADKILFLDTGIPGDTDSAIQAVSDYMGLPFEVLPIGLSHCERLIEALVYRWRENRERQGLNEQIAGFSRKAADYSMVFEQMQRMVDLTDEKDIVAETMQLLNLLFAPEEIDYLKVDPDDPQIETGRGIAGSVKPELSADFFTIEARSRGEVLGIFTLRGFRFPEFVEQYRPMRRILGGLAGLAISNARKFQIIQKNEAQLQDFTLELQAANANKDRFFSIVAHDLKNPLSAFLGLTEIMTEESDWMTIEEIRKTAGVVKKSARTLYNQMENLLEWSRLQFTGISVEPVLFDLRPIVEIEFDLIRTAAEKKQIVLKNRIPELFRIYTDRNMLVTILRNLLVNALKFSHPGGNVIISANFTENGWIELSVVDTGIGMDSQIIDNLFSLHKQTNRKGTAGEPSTGLGLMLSKEFAEKLGGQIRVESEPGQGSAFFVILPGA